MIKPLKILIDYFKKEYKIILLVLYATFCFFSVVYGQMELIQIIFKDKLKLIQIFLAFLAYGNGMFVVICIVEFFKPIINGQHKTEQEN